MPCIHNQLRFLLSVLTLLAQCLSQQDKFWLFKIVFPDALWLEKEGLFSFPPENIIKSSLFISHLNQSQVFQLFIENQVFEVIQGA